MQVLVEKIFINETKQDGTPYRDKNGQPFKMATLYVQGKKYTMFIGQKFGAKDLAVISTWKAGDLVEVILEKNGDYDNFKLPTKTDALEERVATLEGQMKVLQAMVVGKQRNLEEEVPTPEYNF